MNCARCRGLMRAEEFRDWQCGMGADRFHAMRCLVCGEIVDAVILQNRRNAVKGKVRPWRCRVRRRTSILAVGKHYAPLRRRPDTRRFSGRVA
jgi:hypothetical protein